MAGLINLNLGNPTAGGAAPASIATLPNQSTLTGAVGLGGLGSITLGGSGGAVTDPNATAGALTNPVSAYAMAGGLATASTGGATTPALQIDLLSGLTQNTGLGGTVNVATPALTIGSTVGAGAAGSLPDAVTAFTHIFQMASPSEIPQATMDQLHALQSQVDGGAMTQLQAILKIADGAAGFTAVAETSYAFFTGLTPSSAGLTYLVHSPDNPADLSDAYYAGFNLENRYINFASNLGLYSDAAPGFARDYGSLSFDQTVAVAYDRIVGNAEAQAAGIDPQAAVADIEGRQAYFAQVAHERFGDANQDLATKLSAIAYILEEAVKADVGRYGEANQNFLVDLADGNAQFHVDLVGTYGHGTAYDVQ